MARFKLNEQQKKAVEYLEGPLLVLAGPGTGKTQLLSEKTAYILKKMDVNPENILCMTFTESGATNMRERLKSIIGNAGARVHISTYHAFGAEILAEYKNYAEDYPRKLDAAIDEVTQFKIVKGILESLPAKDILKKDNVKDVVSVISEAKAANLSGEDLEKIAKQNIADSKVLSEQISPLLKNVVPRDFATSYRGAYEPIFELLKNYTEIELITKNIERSIGALARDLKTAIAEALEEEKIKPLSSWKDAYFEKDEVGNYRLRDRIANKKLLSIAAVMKKYQEYLAKEGLYDFGDMIQEALKVLEKDRGFQATLAERYQFILLDEFQDTNPAQFAIIKALTDYEKPMIMAVGDDDQAIYEFQGALATNLTDFQEYYEAEVIALTENYRSTQEILDFAQKIIEQAPDRFAEKELRSWKDEQAGDREKGSQIYRYEFLSSDMEYAFIAEKIAELVKNGVPQSEIAVISYKHKYFMPLLPYLQNYPEIKIAYEKKDDLFEDETISEILTIAKYVFELANEKRVDTGAVEILSYPFWRLNMVEVLKLIGEARRNKRAIFEEISASKVTAITEVGGFIAELVRLSLTEPLEIWLDALIGASEVEISAGGNEILVNDGDSDSENNGTKFNENRLAETKVFRSPFLKYFSGKGEYAEFSLYEKLAALRGKLRKHFGDKVLKLADLIEMVEDYKEAGMAMNASSPYRDADEAVQILSAHKAKGLEFRYVFLIAADHTAWGKGKGNNNLLSLPKNLLSIRHTGTTDGEKLRILYVSLTRAKEVLYITNSLRDFNGKSPARLEYLEEYEDGDRVISPFLPRREVSLNYNFSPNAKAAQKLRTYLSPFVKLEPEMRAIYRERVKDLRLSASGLTTFVDVVYGGPEEFFKRYILQAPKEPEDAKMAFGNLVHATFEAVTKKKLTDDEALKFFEEELAKKELASAEKKELLEKGAADLQVSLREFSEILRQGQAEVDLASEKMSVAGVPITGKIDHINVDEGAGTLEIYDFKTGGYHKEKWQSHATLYKYRLQLMFYKLLLNHSEKYRKYKIERAHILFVTPDNDEKVYDKVYEYDAAEEAEFLKLLESVYRLVSSLEFLDDPELFIPADETKGLKELKEFVKLVEEKGSEE